MIKLRNDTPHIFWAKVALGVGSAVVVTAFALSVIGLCAPHALPQGLEAFGRHARLFVGIAAGSIGITLGGVAIVYQKNRSNFTYSALPTEERLIDPNLLVGESVFDAESLFPLHVIAKPHAHGYQRAQSAMHAHAILPFYQNALKNSEDIFTKMLLEAYGQKADFLLYHGAMHASHMALTMPILINFYTYLRDRRIGVLSEQEKHALQIAAFYHPFGRLENKMDTVAESQESLKESALECSRYLTQNGFDDNVCRSMRNAIEKSYCASAQEDVYSEILGLCVTITQMRETSGVRVGPESVNHLKIMQNRDISEKALFLQILEETRQLLIHLGDMPCASLSYTDQKSYQESRFLLDEKKKYETAVDCFEKMEAQLCSFPALRYWYANQLSGDQIQAVML